MSPRKSTLTRIEYSTKALIETLEHYNKLNPGKCITKKELIPRVSRRAGLIIENRDDALLYEDECGLPSEKFIFSRWSDICLRAAEIKKYIVWEPRVGVRLGTFQEYQDIPNSTLAKICKGLSDNCEDRAKIIVYQGGKTLVVSIQIKQLGAGKMQEA